MTAETIMVWAAIIQAIAAIFFRYGVWWDGRLRDRAARRQLSKSCINDGCWPPKSERRLKKELVVPGCPLSLRQNEKFNQWLAEAGENWRVPLPPLRSPWSRFVAWSRRDPPRFPDLP
jgi:hypothetical protein